MRRAYLRAYCLRRSSNQTQARPCASRSRSSIQPDTAEALLMEQSEEIGSSFFLDSFRDCEALGVDPTP